MTLKLILICVMELSRGLFQVFDLESGRELTNQRVPKPMARTNTTIIDFFGTTRFMLGR